MVNTYAAQSGGYRFESLWGFGFSPKGAYYEVGYCGKKNFLSWTAMHIDFVMCKNERGTLWTKFALALGGFRIVSKKWTDQCEDCSLKKNKTGSSQVGAISKAQQYSKNNYWKHLEKLFSKKVF